MKSKRWELGRGVRGMRERLEREGQDQAGSGATNVEEAEPYPGGSGSQGGVLAGGMRLHLRSGRCERCYAEDARERGAWRRVGVWFGEPDLG